MASLAHCPFLLGLPERVFQSPMLTRASFWQPPTRTPLLNRFSLSSLCLFALDGQTSQTLTRRPLRRFHSGLCNLTLFGYSIHVRPAGSWSHGAFNDLLKETLRVFPGGTVDKNLPANAGDTGLILGSGGSHIPWRN